MDVLRLYFLASRVIFIQIPNFPNCVLNITLSREIGSEVVEGGWRAVSFPVKIDAARNCYSFIQALVIVVCVCARVFFHLVRFTTFDLCQKKRVGKSFIFQQYMPFIHCSVHIV